MHVIARSLSLLGAFALLPLVTSAQGIPVRQSFPMPLRSNDSHGITVTGSATTRVPGTSADLTLSFIGRGGKLVLNAQTLQPVIDALVADGIPRDAIQLPLNLSAPGNSSNASIAAHVEAPTAAMLQNGVLKVGTAIAGLPDVILGSAMVRVSAAHCGAAQDATRARAIALARAKAATIAKQLGVRLGRVLNVAAFDTQLAGDSCSWQYYVGAFSPSGPMTSEDYVKVPVTENVTITFAIR